MSWKYDAEKAHMCATILKSGRSVRVSISLLIKRNWRRTWSDFRSMLEPQIAEIAAKKATDKDITELRKLCDEVNSMIANGENYERDIELHTKIASITGNSVVEQIIPLIAQGRVAVRRSDKP